MATTDVWNAFSGRARALAHHAAFVTSDGSVTFGQLMQRAVDHAVSLRERGIAPHDRVLFWVRNDVDLAAAMLGTWAAGGIPVLIDADESEDHLTHAIESVAPRWIVRPADRELPCAAPVPQITPGDVPEGRSGPIEPSPALPTDPASIVFTSGSTGKPKGVTQSHGSLIRGCRTVAGYLGLTHEDRIVCPIPWSFDYGYGQLLSTLIVGATQILPSGKDAISLCSAIDQHRPTVLPGIPSLFMYLLRGVSTIRDIDTSSLRTLTNTGGTIPSPVLDELIGMFPAQKLFLNYGLTESYRTSCLDPALVHSHRTSIGRAIPGVDVRIVGEDGRPAKPGETGEIVHRGAFLFMGYWNDPEATASALKPDPFACADAPARYPALFTGDLGYQDEDGYLYFAGRRDHQIKSMGVRVSPGEIEALLHASGHVEEVAVYGVPHEMIGQEVWAAITVRDPSTNVVPLLKAYARTTMSQYMMPRRYEVRDSLPKTRTGKIDYPKLVEEAMAQR